jgi:PmbA protein
MTGQKQYSDLQQVAQAALDGAKDRGATGVRVRATAGRSTSVAYREGRPDKIEESQSRRLALFLYADGHYASCETNAQTGPALGQFLDRAVALARAVKEDPHRQLPDPTLYPEGEQQDLQLFDGTINNLTNEQRHDYAAELERELVARGQQASLVSAEGRYEEVERWVYQIHSNGFEGRHRETQHWGFAEASLCDSDGKRPSGWAAAGSRSWTGLEPAADLAAQAVERAQARLGAKPISTARLPIIIENRAVGRLLRYVLAVLQGQSLHQKLSFLEDKLNQRVGSEILTLHDDPLVPEGLGSRPFDGEGLAAQRRPIFDRGELKHFYIDTYYGSKLGRPATSGSSSNMTMAPGARSLADMVGAVDHGLLVRGFLGGNSNPATGDFSLGVYGRLITKGQLGEAVSEVNIAGNHLDLWPQLTEVGNDVYRHSSVRLPSLCFDGVQVSGK